MEDLLEKIDIQNERLLKKQSKRAPLYQVFLTVTGPLTGEESGLGIELPEQCEEALRVVFEKSEHEAVQIICETLSSERSLVGEFMWEQADDKVVMANAMLANNNFDPPFNKPVAFELKRR